MNSVFQVGENENDYDDDDMAYEWGMVGHPQDQLIGSLM
jgi:hypothetical protein